MAFSLNQVILLGNVGKEPEIQQLPNKNNVATFTLATSQSYKKKDSNDWVETTDWHTIKAFGNLADTIEKYVHKGNKIEIVGQLKNNNYTDKNEVKHYGYYVQAEKIILLEKGDFKSQPAEEQIENTEPCSDDEIPY
ncbi:single-stranded DNA-binding protein [Pasteurella atlantica]|uniref:single-stranded DNA-binding protein n=1 Tax=Phocoenobacter atlanticus TaxID=3416742 RepID=UPI002754C191|nr:single-stranded DNA-binding protein [Pasteurella atlantica]MDP8042525.1 single-stranded DNA-binding protein [Pasteurella atlantica]